MDKKIPNKIIVLGGNHHNGLGIIRSLGEMGIGVYFIAIGVKKSFVVKSKYIKRYWIVEQEKEVLDILIQNFGKDQFKSIIIPSDDNSATIIDENLDYLIDNFIIPNIKNKSNEISQKMNKNKMNELVSKHGFNVPRSFAINLSGSKNVQSTMMAMDIDYPVIIKPINSINSTKSDIVVCRNNSQLMSKLKELELKYYEVCIQEFIEKKGEIGVQGISTNKGEKVIIPGIVIKKRDSPVSPGSTTYAELVNSNNTRIDISTIKLLVCNLVSALQLEGFFDIELMYDENKMYFIEFNFRNGAYGYAYTKAGTNLPILWCLNSLDKNILSSNDKDTLIKHEISFMNEFSDLKNVLTKKVGLFKWILQLVTVDTLLVFNIKDIKPFLYKIVFK